MFDIKMKALRKNSKRSALEQLKNLKKHIRRLSESVEQIEVYSHGNDKEQFGEIMRETRSEMAKCEKALHEFNAYNNSYKTILEIENE